MSYKKHIWRNNENITASKLNNIEEGVEDVASYQKHVWTNDDDITAERLNAIEDGIASAGSGITTVMMTVNVSNCKDGNRSPYHGDWRMSLPKMYYAEPNGIGGYRLLANPLTGQDNEPTYYGIVYVQNGSGTGYFSTYPTGLSSDYTLVVFDLSHESVLESYDLESAVYSGNVSQERYWGSSPEMDLYSLPLRIITGDFTVSAEFATGPELL